MLLYISYHYLKDYDILIFHDFKIQNSSNGTQVKILGDILLENITCYNGKNYIIYS